VTTRQPDPLVWRSRLGDVKATEEIVSRTARRGYRVALTFDDGPDPRYTPQVLDILAEYGAVATFCLIGAKASNHQDLARRIVAGGHALANHTMTHADLGTYPPHRIRSEIAEADRAIRDAAQAPVRYFRSPYGSWSTLIRLAAMECGLQPLDWSVNPCDWAQPGVAAIVEAIMRDLRPEGVILLHDSAPAGEPRPERDQTVAALRRLIPVLAACGYTFDVPDQPGDSQGPIR